MSDVESLDFESLELIEVPVTIGSVKYVLREADEGAAREFRNARLKGATLKDGDAATLPDDPGGLQSLLLSGCIFRCNEEGEPFSSPVSRREITGYMTPNGTRYKGWPARIVKPLYEKAKEISELDETEGTIDDLTKQRDKLNDIIGRLKEETAKNEQSDTMTGSG